MIWLFHKTILAEVKRNNDQRGHWTKARFPWSMETLGPRNPFRREGIMTLKDPSREMDRLMTFLALW